MIKWLLLFLFLLPGIVVAQKEITWKTLNDVEFESKYIEEVDANYYYPTFGPTVKALEGQVLLLKGFVLAIDPIENYYILSRHPYASCYFCGSGGPDSVVELKLKSAKKKYKMDQIVTVKGRLRLNADDIYECNYILEEAEVYTD